MVVDDFKESKIAYTSDAMNNNSNHIIGFESIQVLATPYHRITRRYIQIPSKYTYIKTLAKQKK